MNKKVNVLTQNVILDQYWNSMEVAKNVRRSKFQTQMEDIALMQYAQKMTT